MLSLDRCYLFLAVWFSSLGLLLLSTPAWYISIFLFDDKLKTEFMTTCFIIGMLQLFAGYIIYEMWKAKDYRYRYFGFYWFLFLTLHGLTGLLFLGNLFYLFLPVTMVIPTCMIYFAIHHDGGKYGSNINNGLK